MALAVQIPGAVSFLPVLPMASALRAADVLDAEEALQRQIEDLTRQQFAVAGDDWGAGMLQ